MTNLGASRHPNRRAFLGLGGIALLMLPGCGVVDEFLGEDPESDAEEPPVRPDERLRRRALRDQRDLLATASAVQNRHRDIGSPLRTIVAHHREHVTTLGGSASNRRTSAPANASRALARLADLERTAARHRRHDAGNAEAGELARVFAAIAASLEQHAYVLERIEAA